MKKHYLSPIVLWLHPKDKTAIEQAALAAGSTPHDFMLLAGWTEARKHCEREENLLPKFIKY